MSAFQLCSFSHFPVGLLSYISDFLSISDVLTLSFCQSDLRTLLVRVLVPRLKFDFLSVGYLSRYLLPLVKKYHHKGEMFSVLDRNIPKVPFAPVVLEWEKIYTFDSELDCFGVHVDSEDALPKHLISIGYLPKSLKELYIDSYAPFELPSSLTTLIYFDSVNNAILKLPTTLGRFEVRGCLQSPITTGWLPTSLTYLQIDEYPFALSLHTLPLGLNALLIGTGFNQDLSGVLPSCLRTLRLGSSFTASLAVGTLPSGLTTLCLQGFNHSLPSGVLPVGLKILRLDKFNVPLDCDTLPSCLEELDLPCYQQPLIHPLPKSLLRLRVCFKSFYLFSESVIAPPPQVQIF